MGQADASGFCALFIRERMQWCIHSFAPAPDRTDTVSIPDGHRTDTGWTPICRHLTRVRTSDSALHPKCRRGRTRDGPDDDAPAGKSTPNSRWTLGGVCLAAGQVRAPLSAAGTAKADVPAGCRRTPSQREAGRQGQAHDGGSGLCDVEPRPARRSKRGALARRCGTDLHAGRMAGAEAAPARARAWSECGPITAGGDDTRAQAARPALPATADSAACTKHAALASGCPTHCKRGNTNSGGDACGHQGDHQAT